MKGLKAFLIIFLVQKTTEAINTQNFFPDFECSGDRCKIHDVLQDLQEIYNKLNSNKFEYAANNNNYNCRNYGKAYCQMIRHEFESYTELEFVNSKFERFPSGDNQKFNHIKKLWAVNVGLVEINRDDLKPFRSLEELDLSENNITKLNNLFLLHVSSLSNLDLHKNQISMIDTLAFDASNKNLIYLDLSYNELTEINENLLDIIGNHDYSKLWLEHNKIEKINPSTTAIESSRKFMTLSLNNNKLKSFIYNCSSISTLTLNDNQIEEFEICNCSVNILHLTNNNLKSFKISFAKELSISNNVNLQDLTLNVTNLETLEMKNLPVKLLSYDILKNATKLKILDAANTFLGPLKIDTLAEMNLLQFLNLSNTGLLHIEYGMFSHQRQVTTLDISGNNLETIDINMLASLKNLTTFYIRNNNLTKFDHIENIQSIFPSLQIIQIDGNQWNCSYLANLLKIFSEKSIEVEEPLNPVKDSPNVLGIKCITTAHSKIQTISADLSNETISRKLNEIIEQINEEKLKKDIHKFDSDVIKSEIFSIQKEILEIKSKIVKLEVNENLKQASKSNNSVDMIAIKIMMEQLNNITLERQKISYDQLVNKINEQGIDIKTLGVEIERIKNQAPQKSFQNELNPQILQPIHYASQSDLQNQTKSTEVLLIILITSLVIIVAIFGYMKLKKSLHAKRNMMGVRARSTNTMNTSIELPFGDERN